MLEIEDQTSVTTICVVLVVAVVVVSLAISILNNFNKKKNKKKISNAPPRPPIVPSYIPFLGPVFELTNLGFGKFIQKYSNQLNNAPIVTAKIGGKTLHFIADPAAFPSIFRYNMKQLSMLPAIEDFSKSFFGMSKEGLSTFNPEARKQNMDALHKHFVHSQGLQKLTESAQMVINKQIDSHIVGTTASSSDSNNSSSSITETVQLYDMVRKTVFYATLQSTISTSVADDDFIATFELFDKAIPTAFAGLPLRYCASKSYEAREKLVKILENNDNSFVPSDYLEERRAFLLSLGMSKNDIARDNLLWVWGAGTNFIPSQFWQIYFILSNKEALDGIRKEVDVILSERPDDEPFDGTFTVPELDRMVGIESAFKESNRLAMTNMVSRIVMEDMELDLKLTDKKRSKYFVEKGSNIILYPPILHHDPTVFDKPKEYRWDRFLIDPTTGESPIFMTANGDKIADPFRAFGGGAHYCPGRKFATNIAKSFTANLVYRYDMKLLGSTEYDFARDAFGVLHPKNDVNIQIKSRGERGNE